MTITIVTPWYQHHELMQDYTDAVLPELVSGDMVVIVDNGDAPDLPFTDEPSHLQVTTVARPDIGNLGFVKGSNFGLLHADTDGVLMLNNDVAPKREGWLNEIRYALEPGVLVGPLRDGRWASVDGVAFPYIDGWCLAGMREDLLALGGFSEELQEPAYFSDNLLCLEARAAGMRLRDLRPGLIHKENVTAGPASAPDVQAASAANRARYVARARELLVTA